MRIVVVALPSTHDSDDDAIRHIEDLLKRAGIKYRLIEIIDPPDEGVPV